jgi:N-acetylneuraminic acid mutarotase
VANGLFTVDLDFGPGAFDGNARWLEIRVQGAADPSFTTLAPRTPVRPSPYALLAGTVLDGAITSSKIANGAVNGSNIAAGSITAAQLASGSAFANLLASGQSGVAGGGIVLSENPNNISLANAGYVRIGKVDLVAEGWTINASGPPTSGTTANRTRHTAVWTGAEMIIWGGENISFRNDGLRYNPVTDTWIATSKSGAPSARSGHSAVWTGTQMIIWGGPDNRGGRYNPATDSWTATSRNNAPSARYGHVAVWTGSLMLVWGGFFSAAGTPLNDGGRYNPSTDTWADMASTGAPSPRADASFVWTGARLIVWGGTDDQAGQFANVFSDGAKYNPTADSWTAISSSGAPLPREQAAAVWTGSEMLVWGGLTYFFAGGLTTTRTGGRYNSAADSWSPITASGAPTARTAHSVVWGGNRMIVWGGYSGGLVYNSGGRYDPSTDSWSPTAASGAPSARLDHTSVWTGSRMIVFGGVDSDFNPFGDASRYDVANDTWTATSAAIGGSEPSERQGATAVWTGSEMIVWGGEYQGTYLHTGGRYDPVVNDWIATRLSGAPSGRINHTAVWTGAEMIIWGGVDEAEAATGARFNPVLNRWTTLSLSNAPSARQSHTAVWTGTEMIVWGGASNIFVNGYGDLPSEFSTGGRYNPSTDTWTPVSSGANRPASRQGHACVWTGNEMIVWGGYRSIFAIPSPTKSYWGDGARYQPASDAWISLPQTNAPIPRGGAGAVWTGTDLIVWAGTDATGTGAGGVRKTGGRYNLASNTWTALNTNGVPASRHDPDAFWDGAHVIFWGGMAGANILNDGGRYDPLTDSWAPVSDTGAPQPRGGHAAAWTGAQMLVVGGLDLSGIYRNDHYAYAPPRTVYLYLKP